MSLTPVRGLCIVETWKTLQESIEFDKLFDKQRDYDMYKCTHNLYVKAILGYEKKRCGANL